MWSVAGAKGAGHLRRGLKFVFNFLMMKKIIRILGCTLTSQQVKPNACPHDENGFQ